MPTFQEYISGRVRFEQPKVSEPPERRPAQRQALTQADFNAALSYAFGLTNTKPRVMLFDADPARVRGFVSRWMAQHNLKLVKR
ncbi:hypothetical protein OT109_01450 [Phycisphaeraceae bacterium D3-23]